MLCSLQLHVPAALAAVLFLGPVAAPFQSASGGHADGGVTVEVLRDSPASVVLDIQLGDFESRPVVIDGKTLLSLEVHGEGNFNGVGQPSLPRLARSVMLPDQGGVAVRVLSSAYHEIEGVDVVPSKGPITRDIDPDSVPWTFGVDYTQDAFFPPTSVALREPYILRDVRGVVLEGNLFQYNPVRRTLRVYDSLTVEVSATTEPGINELDRTAFPARPDRNFSGMYRSHFVNGSNRLGATINRSGPEGQCGDMLIIAYGPFLPAVQPLVDWKNSIGIHTTVVDIATIGNNPTLIKDFITSIYNSSNLAYVLLVGDAPQITSFTYQGGYSDPTFSTLTPDWYPDLLVGRFSAQTPEQVQTQVERTIAYEAAPHEASMGGWNAKTMGIASDQGPGHYGEYDNAHMDLIRGQYLAAGYRAVDQIYDPTGTKTHVKLGLEEGRRFVNYVGHGSSSSWGSTGFSSNDVNQLKNAGKLPVIHSVACVNGDFGQSSCFAETWLRATDAGQPTGAVATYMSTINQYWNEPMYGQACHGKNGKYSYVGLELAEADWSVAGLWFAGSSVMMDISGASGRDMFLTWTCFGDPSLCVLGQNEVKGLLVDNLVIPTTVPTLTGFTVTEGLAAAGDTYFLMASLSGVDPGTPLAGGEVLPLNFDGLTAYSLGHPLGPVFLSFFGTLDSNGEAFPSFTTTPLVPLDPALIGQAVDFAAATWTTPDVMHATNVVTMTVTP